MESILKDQIMLCIQKQFDNLFAREGFMFVPGKIGRWQKVIGQSVLLSVQFVPCGCGYDIYYGHQPFFFPIQFPSSRVRFLNMGMVFFPAETEYVRSVYVKSGQKPPVYAVVPQDPGSLERAIPYWQTVLDAVVFPTLRMVTDVASGHDVYQAYRLTWRNERLDGRNLLESVYLGDDAAVERIRDQVLRPIQAEFSPSHEVYLNYDWLFKKAPKGIPVGELIEDLGGSRQLIWAMMDKTIKRSQKWLLANTSTEGTSK